MATSTSPDRVAGYMIPAIIVDEFDNVVATIEISGDLLNDPRVAKVVNAVDSALAIWTLKTECSLRWRPLKEIAYVTIE